MTEGDTLGDSGAARREYDATQFVATGNKLCRNRRAVACRPRDIGRDGSIYIGKGSGRIDEGRRGSKLLWQGSASTRDGHDAYSRERQRQDDVKDFVVQKDSNNIAALEAELKDSARETVQHMFELRICDRLQSGARRADRRLVGAHPALKQNWIDDIHELVR